MLDFEYKLFVLIGVSILLLIAIGLAVWFAVVACEKKRTAKGKKLRGEYINLPPTARPDLVPTSRQWKISGYSLPSSPSYSGSLPMIDDNGDCDSYIEPEEEPSDNSNILKQGQNMGRLSFSFTYDTEGGILYLRLVKISQLAIPRNGSFRNPVIRVTFITQKEYRNQAASKPSNDESSVERDDNAEYQTPLSIDLNDQTLNQEYVLKVSKKRVKDYVIQIRCCALDKYLHPVALGEAILALKSYRVHESTEHQADMKALEKHCCGQILLSLHVYPTAERLSLTVIKAKNLSMREDETTINPSIRASLYNENQLISRQKTVGRQNTASPTFNETLVFNVPHHHYNRVRLNVTATSFNGKGHHIIGRTILGPNGSAKAAAHWAQMTLSSQKQIAYWYELS